MIPEIISALTDNMTIANLLPTSAMLLIVLPNFKEKMDRINGDRKDRDLERKRKEIELNHLEAELKQKEHDISNQHALEDTKMLLSIAPEALRNSISVQDLADLFRTARGDQPMPQHDHDLPDSDSDEPRKPDRSPED